MDIGQLVKEAMAAEQKGIPVNWKELCITVLNAAVQRVGELEQQVSKYESHLEESLTAPDATLETSS